MNKNKKEEIKQPKPDQFSEYFVRPAKQKKNRLSNLDFSEIHKLFITKGCVIFKDFRILDEDLIAFTNLYSHSYAADAMRRESVLGEKYVKNVDSGNEKIKIHSEASFTKAWPEMIWFFCKVPPEDRGETIFCDGIKLWDSLDEATKTFFYYNPIVYNLAIPVIKNRKGGGTQPWPIHSVGVGESYIDWEKGVLFMKQIRFAVHDSRIPGKFCFANHLFVDFETEPQIISRHLLNGEPIPEDIMNEIVNNAKNLTYKYKWEKNDLVMLDNKRFLHGREPFRSGDPREIVQIQTQKASFAYDSLGREPKV